MTGGFSQQQRVIDDLLKTTTESVQLGADCIDAIADAWRAMGREIKEQGDE